LFSFKNAIWVSKNVECYADFEFIEKVAKKLMPKKYSTKNGVLVLVLCAKVFGLSIPVFG
jgi:hypothetical protein